MSTVHHLQDTIDRSGRTRRHDSDKAKGTFPESSVCRESIAVCHTGWWTWGTGNGRSLLTSPKKQILFSQGNTADAVFYIQEGQVKLSVVSQEGKEAVIAILEGGALLGESCLAGQTVRPATATSVEDSRLVRIDKEVMIRLLHEAPAFSELFLTHLLFSQHAHPRGRGGSSLQFQREAAGAAAAVTGPLRERRPYGGLPSEAQPGNARRDDRHHARPRQFLHD
jgi:Cyclic nucleotide-binding domain